MEDISSSGEAVPGLYAYFSERGRTQEPVVDSVGVQQHHDYDPPYAGAGIPPYHPSCDRPGNPAACCYIPPDDDPTAPFDVAAFLRYLNNRDNGAR